MSRKKCRNRKIFLGNPKKLSGTATAQICHLGASTPQRTQGVTHGVLQQPLASAQEGPCSNIGLKDPDALKIPAPKGRNSTQSGSARSPFPAEPEHLELEQVKLERRRADREWNERLEQESYLASLSLPSKDAAQRILRYEATIERELHRTIKQLARLQRARKGKYGSK